VWYGVLSGHHAWGCLGAQRKKAAEAEGGQPKKPVVEVVEMIGEPHDDAPIPTVGDTVNIHYVIMSRDRRHLYPHYPVLTSENGGMVRRLRGRVKIMGSIIITAD
jgi:hypothetical protein